MFCYTNSGLLPSALNLVKKVADFRFISGNMTRIRNRGTVEYWSQILSKLESPGTEELLGRTLGVSFLGQ